MLTDDEMMTIANKLESKFNTDFMSRVNAVMDELETIYDEHLNNGGFKSCSNSGGDYARIFAEVCPKPEYTYWDSIWFTPDDDMRGVLLVSKGVGEGCHFGHKECVEGYYNRFHDHIFGAHFTPSNWARNEGIYSRKSVMEFVRDNINTPCVIIHAIQRIDDLVAERIPHLEALPNILRKALEKAVAESRDEEIRRDNILRQAFGL